MFPFADHGQVPGGGYQVTGSAAGPDSTNPCTHSTVSSGTATRSPATRSPGIRSPGIRRPRARRGRSELHAGERGAEAVVRSAAERDVGVLPAGEEPVRVREPLRVAVGALQPDEHQVTGRDPDT